MSLPVSMNLMTNRLYTTFMRRSRISKANLSSYVKKPAASSKNSTSGSAATSFKTAGFSSPSGGSSSIGSTGHSSSSRNSFDPTKSAETAAKNTDAFQKVKTINTIFPVTLNDLSVNNLNEIDWSTSFSGIGSRPFPAETQEVLAAPLGPKEIEIKPEGLLYLPEIKYRRVLNKAFGAGGWGLVPRSETIVTDSLVTREYGLVCLGQLVSISRGEQDYFGATNIPMATEGCKSNALMRCCKDLGIASELWDPNFIKSFKEKHCEDKFAEHVVSKKVKKIWKRKDRTIDYPYKIK